MDTLTFIAGARGRGVPERTLARWAGLKDGMAAFTTMRQAVEPIVVVPSTRPIKPARIAAAMYAPAMNTPPAIINRATGAPDISIQAKCQGAPMTTVPTPMPTIPDFLRIVADIAHVSVTDLRSARRAREVARPRQVAMWLARKYTPLSLPSIGRAIGNRDHTTVMHAARRVDEMLAEGHPFVTQWIADAEKALAAKFPHVCGV